MAKNTSTHATTDKSEHGWRSYLRNAVLWLSIAIGCLGLSAYIVVHWAERQILVTDNWVALVSPLPKQPVVSTALGNYIGDQVFAAVPVENKIADALPPNAAFLAGSLTDQLHTLTTRSSQKIVASDGFQTVWEGANRVAMNRLLATARNQTPPAQAKLNEKFGINIGQASDQLRQALGQASAAIPALQPTSQKALTISTDLHAKPRRIHQVIRTLDSLAKILPLLTAASFLVALALAWRRRRVAIIISGVLIFCILLELIAIKILRQETLDQVRNPGNLSAIGYIYDTLLSQLKHGMYSVMIALLVILGLLLAAGPAKWAKAARSFIHIEQLSTSQVMARWRTMRQWVKRYEYRLWVGFVFVIVAVLALTVSVTAQSVLNALFLVICLLALTHIVAHPRPMLPGGADSPA